MMITMMIIALPFAAYTRLQQLWLVVVVQDVVVTGTDVCVCVGGGGGGEGEGTSEGNN